MLQNLCSAVQTCLQQLSSCRTLGLTISLPFVTCPSAMMTTCETGKLCACVSGTGWQPCVVYALHTLQGLQPTRLVALADAQNGCAPALSCLPCSRHAVHAAGHRRCAPALMPGPCRHACMHEEQLNRAQAIKCNTCC